MSRLGADGADGHVPSEPLWFQASGLRAAAFLTDKSSSVCVCVCVCVPAQASYCDRPVPHLVLRLSADVLPGRSRLCRLRE